MRLSGGRLWRMDDKNRSKLTKFSKIREEQKRHMYCSHPAPKGQNADMEWIFPSKIAAYAYENRHMVCEFANLSKPCEKFCEKCKKT